MGIAVSFTLAGIEFSDFQESFEFYKLLEVIIRFKYNTKEKTMK